jgi:hypothetical protein
MKHAEFVAQAVVRGCNKDFVGLWSVIRQVRELCVTGYAQLQTTTLTLIKDLMKYHEIVAGQFDNHIFK